MTDDRSCPCIFPSASEEELITIPGAETGTALRLFVEPGQEGYVRLQQLAFADGVGWYVQKSMVIPGQMLSTLVPQLNKARCLIPPTHRPPQEQRDAVPFLRLVQDDTDDKPTLERKRA